MSNDNRIRCRNHSCLQVLAVRVSAEGERWRALSDFIVRDRQRISLICPVCGRIRTLAQHDDEDTGLPRAA